MKRVLDLLLKIIIESQGYEILGFSSSYITVRIRLLCLL